jgi:hypothetical protein
MVGRWIEQEQCRTGRCVATRGTRALTVRADTHGVRRACHSAPLNIRSTGADQFIRGASMLVAILTTIGVVCLLIFAWDWLRERRRH